MQESNICENINCFNRSFIFTILLYYLGIYVSAEVVSGLLVFCVSRKDRVLGRDFFMLCGIGTVSVKCASELTKITVLVIS